ncbi:hypothetical protein COY27_02860 [Candidatus Woesearchaeota archaeon CG_4_10_14_0_2_um_filter_33_13]|nr:MAG: hypothetical protein COY27_02860 [Candidatus Woesearchaeota archaeon CG_4_10_14_0_2_um_filter_33_13]
MVVLRSRVVCFRCNNPVNRLDTVKTASKNGEPRYECSVCYKKQKTAQWGVGDEIPVKAECFCQRCKYHFKSKSGLCPYCSQKDLVIKGKITVHDLL